jgi:hypothetical protein
MATNGTDDGLNPRQRRLIAELLAQPTTNAALEAAGVGASTLSRWRREPAFVDALDAARRELFADGYATLLSWQSGNLAELWRLASEAETDGIRLRAAVALEAALVRRFELLTLSDLERRIAALEAQP